MVIFGKANHQNKLTAPENFVSMMPGATQFTLMLSGDNSKLRALVRPKSAVLLTEYGMIICRRKERLI